MAIVLLPQPPFALMTVMMFMLIIVIDRETFYGLIQGGAELRSGLPLKVGTPQLPAGSGQSCSMAARRSPSRLDFTWR